MSGGKGERQEAVVLTAFACGWVAVGEWNWWDSRAWQHGLAAGEMKRLHEYGREAAVVLGEGGSLEGRGPFQVGGRRLLVEWELLSRRPGILAG